MKARLQTSLGQHLIMTPQLRQAIRLLQMSTLELQAEVAEAIETNPLLEWTEDAPYDSPAPADGKSATDDARAQDEGADRSQDGGDDWSPDEGAWTASAAVPGDRRTTARMPPNAWPNRRTWPTTCSGSCTCRIFPSATAASARR